MKIIECYIDNFGTLSNFKYVFNSGLNSFAEENGFGKTTLSVFLKSMFYGLSDTRSTSLDKNDRKRYMPWQGGRFGGSLVFEKDGKKYRIERTFAAKASEDLFKLYNDETGSDCFDFSEKIGEELFGIDADGFERTVFLSEANLSGKNENKTVSAKLSDLSGTEGDLSVMDDAIARLDEERKTYKKRGGKGEIENAEIRVRELNDKIEYAEKTKAQLEEHESDLKNANLNLQKLEKEISQLDQIDQSNAEKRARKQLEKHYLNLKKELDAERSSLTETEKFFKSGLPSVSETDRHRYDKSEAERIMAELAADAPSEEYKTLCEVFKPEPTDDEIRDAERALFKCETICEKIESIKKNAGAQPADIPEISEIEHHISLIEKKSAAVPFIIFISLLFIAAGGLLGCFLHYILFSISALGAILLCFIPLFTKKGKKNLKIAKEFYKKATGTEAGNDVKSKLYALKEKRNSLMHDDRSEELKLLENEFSCENEKIHSLLSRYGIEEGGLDALKTKHESYRRAKFNEERRKAESCEKAKKANKLLQNASEFLALYPTVSDKPFDEIIENSRKLTALDKRISELEENLAEFVKSNDIDVNSISEVEEIFVNTEERRSTLKRELNDINLKISWFNGKCKEENEIVDTLDALYLEKEAAVEDVIKYNQTYDTIIKTQEFLKLAKDSLTEKYLSKTHSSFNKYIEFIASEEAEDFKLDTSFVLTKSERGVLRSVDAYSKGMRDIYALVVRLALIDALYDSETPFIILDDPFAYFDDAHKNSAVKLLKEISKEKQIIYFTCTDDRAV